MKKKGNFIHYLQNVENHRCIEESASVVETYQPKAEYFTTASHELCPFYGFAVSAPIGYADITCFKEKSAPVDNFSVPKDVFSLVELGIMEQLEADAPVIIDGTYVYIVGVADELPEGGERVEASELPYILDSELYLVEEGVYSK